MRNPSLEITTVALAPWAEGLAEVPPKPGQRNRLVMQSLADGRKQPRRLPLTIEDLRPHFWKRGKQMPSGCIEWQGSVDSYGYGTQRLNKRVFKSHRIAFFLENGFLPSDRIVCHTCDNPKCINPKHLFLGNDKINVGDAIVKGKHVSVTKSNAHPHRTT